jgi:predicted secreted protein
MKKEDEERVVEGKREAENMIKHVKTEMLMFCMPRNVYQSWPTARTALEYYNFERRPINKNMADQPSIRRLLVTLLMETLRVQYFLFIPQVLKDH